MARGILELGSIQALQQKGKHIYNSNAMCVWSVRKAEKGGGALLYFGVDEMK